MTTGRLSSPRTPLTSVANATTDNKKPAAATRPLLTAQICLQRHQQQQQRQRQAHQHQVDNFMMYIKAYVCMQGCKATPANCPRQMAKSLPRGVEKFLA